MLNVAISGASGRMGSEVRKLIQEKSDTFSFSFGYAKKEEEPQITSSLEGWDPQKIDVVVDFSLPASFTEIFKWCSAHQIPLVSGTTGMNLEEFKRPNFPFMHSGNYSLGIAGLLRAVEAFRSLQTGDLKVWVEDYHHTKKLDAPSGTALKIQDKLRKEGFGESPIASQRAGSIFGVHQVHMVTDQEWISLKHEALNRAVFAEGALNAARWLRDQGPGFYTLEDFLNAEN